MKIGTFINHGTIIEIESIQTMNLSVDKGQVRIGGQGLDEFIRTATAGDDGASVSVDASASDGVASVDASVSDGLVDAYTDAKKASGEAVPASAADAYAGVSSKDEASLSGASQAPSEPGDGACGVPFSEAQQKASGIKIQAGVVLMLMRRMQPLFTQKVDWLSFYSVLLRRRWVDDNLRAFCRMASQLFGVQLDPRTLSADLRTNGPDYTRWTDADKRILRRKRLATDFDTRLTEYFERKRAEVLRGIVE